MELCTDDLSHLPNPMVASLLAYTGLYRPQGLFLDAVLRNNLLGAIRIGTYTEIVMLPAILSWLIVNAPARSWGSSEAVTAWVAKHDEGIPF